MPIAIRLPPRVTLFLLALLLPAATISAISLEEERSSVDVLFVKGLVQSVAAAENSLTIRPKKGRKFIVNLNQLTEFKGFYKLEELQKRQTIKVWYRPGPSGNTALKIVRPPELGC